MPNEYRGEAALRVAAEVVRLGEADAHVVLVGMNEDGDRSAAEVLAAYYRLDKAIRLGVLANMRAEAGTDAALRLAR